MTLMGTEQLRAHLRTSLACPVSAVLVEQLAGQDTVEYEILRDSAGRTRLSVREQDEPLLITDGTRAHWRDAEGWQDEPEPVHVFSRLRLMLEPNRLIWVQSSPADLRAVGAPRPVVCLGRRGMAVQLKPDSRSGRPSNLPAPAGGCELVADTNLPVLLRLSAGRKQLALTELVELAVEPDPQLWKRRT